MKIHPFLRHVVPLLATACFALTAHANPAEVQALLKQGQFSKALESADRLLAGQPKDPQLRFLRGVALTELGRPNDAIAAFQALTTDFPELPEPYNNLAVLYAQQRQFDKAKSALELAIRTHPAYATAHENLGDVYARLANEAYNKALQIDSANVGAQTKLALIRELITASSKPGATVVAAAPARPVEPVSAPKAALEPVAPVASEAPVAAARPQAAPAPAPAPAPAQPAPASESAVAAQDEQAVQRAVQSWASAWSRKDVRAYLAAYDRDFKTPGGRSRKAWEDERSQRVGKPGSISVQLENIDIKVDGDRAEARFRQHYNSNNFDASTNKRLVLIKRGGQWRIQQELVGG